MKKIVAIRGRQTRGGEYKQKMEINKDGLCNTLTTVEKDNYVIEYDEKNKDKTGNEKRVRGVL